jgi:hypothetical protein
MIFKIKQKRLCRKCSNFRESKKELICKILGDIKLPDHPYCSWYKEKGAEVNGSNRK